jgi:signal transduction histidine kinase
VDTRLNRAEVLVPTGLVVLGAFELLQLRPEGLGTALAVEVVAAVLLLWRRSFTLVACTASALVLLLLPWVGPQLDEVATPILYIAVVCYSLGRWIPNLRGLIGIGLLLLMTLVDYVGVDAREHNITDVVFVCALSLPPWVFGRITRKLAVQSEQLARQQELIRDQAVREERDRIARELHDVIAHSLSAMVVQTAAAQDLVRLAPDRAGELLDSVAETGRKALAETGRLLHLIRDDADELGLRPAPGLADLPELVSNFQGSGLQVEAVLALPDEPLPGGIDVSAYRVVQELLTNALKYAAGPVRLLVEVRDGGLLISCDNRVGRQSAVVGSGLGLPGMAERVGLLGGTLLHGPADDRFVVEARIPLAQGAE